LSAFSFHPSSTIHFLYYLLYTTTTTVWEFSFQVFFSFALFLFLFLFLFFLFSWFFASRPWPIREKNLIYSEDTFSCGILCLQRAGTFRSTSEHYDLKMFVFFFFGFEKEIVKPLSHRCLYSFTMSLFLYAKEIFVIVLTRGKALEQRALPKIGPKLSYRLSLRPIFPIMHLSSSFTLHVKDLWETF